MLPKSDRSVNTQPQDSEPFPDTRGMGNDGANDGVAIKPSPSPVGRPKRRPAERNDAVVRRFAEYLLAGGVSCEMRVIGARLAPNGYAERSDYRKGVLAANIDNVESFASCAMRPSGVSAFATINPVSPDLLARNYNDLKSAQHTATDGDIPVLRHGLIDIDPVRAADISSTDAELAAATAKRDAILAAHPELADCSLSGSSGNGMFILFLMDDLPNDEHHRELVGKVLDILHAIHSDDAVKIDTTTRNPSRIMAIPGTVKAKGSNIPARPWRTATLDREPKEGCRFDPEAFVAKYAHVLPPSKATGRPTSNHPTTPTVAHGEPSDAYTRYAETIENAELQAVANAQEGDRNNQLNRSALAIGTLIGAGVRDRSNAEAQLLTAALAIGLDEGEALATIRSGLNKGESEPRDLSHVGQRSSASRSGSPVSGEAASAPDDEGAWRAPIEISTNEYAINTEVISVLSRCPEVFQRGEALVTVRRDLAPSKTILRPQGSPVIAMLPEPSIREIISREVNFFRVSEGEDGVKRTPVPVPGWNVKAIANRGEYPGVRHIVGVVDAPTFRPDGTILDTPGYDEATGLLYEPSGEFPAILENPTHDDVKRAAETLLGLVSDFPFVSLSDAAAWLCALLTVLARFAINGPCPLQLITANCPGTGKGLLSDVIALIALGRRMAITSAPDNDEEMRKRITAIVLAGDRIALLDNIDTALGSASLDAALTGTIWTDRLMGHSEMMPPLPLYTVWFATGNNMLLRGDMVRRVSPIRLETPLENPEQRSDLKHPNLAEHVATHRMKYLAAGLTVLRGYFTAGRPGVAGENLGSYEAWSGVARSATIWATGFDPCETRAQLKDEDPQTLARRALVEGWAELPGSEYGVTVAQALAWLNKEGCGSDFPTLRAAFLDMSRDGRLPAPRTIGMKLNAIKNRVVDGRSIRSIDGGKNTKAWKIETLDGGTSGTSGTKTPPRKIHEQENISETNMEGGGFSPTSPTSPTVEGERERFAC